ncbi:hypothetical protein ES703_113751 [subsurface metagenome]
MGLAGAIVAQGQGFADVGMGIGMIVMGLASVIIGEALFRPKGVARLLVAAVGGGLSPTACLSPLPLGWAWRRAT